jgi:hypothetical protein
MALSLSMMLYDIGFSQPEKNTVTPLRVSYILIASAISSNALSMEARYQTSNELSISKSDPPVFLQFSLNFRRQFSA